VPGGVFDVFDFVGLRVVQAVKAGMHVNYQLMREKIKQNEAKKLILLDYLAH